MINELLYVKLSSVQTDLLINKIRETLLENISNGEIVFEEDQLSERYNIKGIKWDINLTIIE